MGRVLRAKVKNDYEFVSTYLRILNGTLQLTPTELRVLTEVVYVRFQMEIEGATREEIEELLFSNDFREVMCERLSKEDKPMSKQSLTAYLKVMLNKGFILNTTNGYEVWERLIPVEELVFKIERNAGLT